MPQSRRVRKIFLLMLLSGLFAPMGGGTKALAWNPEIRASERLLRTDVEFLSDSLCSGRKSGTAGNGEAAAYICRRLKGIGYGFEVQTTAKDGVIFRNIIASASGTSSFDRNHKGILVMCCYDGMGIIGEKMYPGADSNSSGVAAALALAGILKGRTDIAFAFTDGHNSNSAGASALPELVPAGHLKMVLNMDIIGSTLAPVESAWTRFMIVLGASHLESRLQKLNEGLGLHLYYSYYRSKSFTDLFYRKIGEHRFYLGNGIPVLFFTSGITMNTNRSTDTAPTLDYPVLARRVELIARLLESTK